MAALVHAFELMIRYADRPMASADASLGVTAETERMRKIFTIERNDYSIYRVQRGHRYYDFEVVG